MLTSGLVNKSIAYIMQHLNEEITIEDVAAHCHFSKYYFSRVFKAETGESVYAFVKRLRLNQSALRLKVERKRTITDIGIDYGYSASNYSSAFKKQHQISPAQFRKKIRVNKWVHPAYGGKAQELHTFDTYNKNIAIREYKDFLVIYERYIGNYIEMKQNWCDFTKRYKAYMTKDTKLIERSYDDPVITNVEQCLYDICMSVKPDCSLENTMIIKGGRFAVYRFEGFIEELFVVFQGIFNIWLPQSGYEMDERYGMDIYQTIDSEAMFFAMDLCIPIK